MLFLYTFAILDVVSHGLRAFWWGPLMLVAWTLFFTWIITSIKRESRQAE